jgi:hypothetical protein
MPNFIVLSRGAETVADIARFGRAKLSFLQRFLPDHAQLTPWPDDLPKWETLSADENARQAAKSHKTVAYRHLT